jgi:hypothetical protein
MSIIIRRLFIRAARKILPEKAVGRLSNWQYDYISLRHHTRRASYDLPSFVISYPRSGSNFLQSVLRSSSGLHCVPIYNNYTHPQKYLSLKSHAPSYVHLLGELSRFAPTMQILPSKFVILWRDPRDVMISFYKYVQVSESVRLSQREFLTEHMYYRPVLGFRAESVTQAYRTFVRNWYSLELPAENSQGVPATWIAVKYEQLVDNPQEQFQRIFDFLELDCPLNQRAVLKRVAVVEPLSKQITRRKWINSVDEYFDLLKIVNTELAAEIELLGYA